MTTTQSIQDSAPYLQPEFSRQFQDPAVELARRRMLESYFGPEGLISQQIPVPIQQIAGLSPQEIQARNLAQGLGGFGQQLAEAQDRGHQERPREQERGPGVYNQGTASKQATR